MSEGTRFAPPASVSPNGDTYDPIQDTAKAHAANVRQLQHRVRNWQIQCGFLWLAFFTMLVGVLLAISKIEIQTQIIEVAETGQIRNVGILPGPQRGATPTVIHTLMRGWLYNMRRVGIDKVMLQEQFHHAGDFMTGPTIRMSESFRKERVAMFERGETTQLDIDEPLPMTPDSHSIELEWQEEVVSRTGTLVSRDRWKAIINLVVWEEKDVPKDKLSVKPRNPLWLFVSDYAWQKLPPRKENK